MAGGTASALQFETPSSYLVAGPTGSGKTSWIRSLILHKDSVFKKPPEAIHYCYSVWQPQMFNSMLTESNVQFHQGLPTTDMIRSWSEEINGEHCMVVLDDLQQDVCSSKETANFFTVISHHMNISFFF